MRSREFLRAVLNSSPIIVLARLGLLEDAINIFGEVEVPRGVLEEIERRKDEVYVEVTRLIKEGKIRVEEVRKQLPRLGLGESSAILLALMKEKIVVLDDKKARKLARDLGIEVIGTLSILKKLRDEGLLKETPNSLYKRLVEIKFYVDKEVFDRIFE
ncbi:MAG: DUF3368 domain-containing protein [Candidatus Baldrarchaeia archaeon]